MASETAAESEANPNGDGAITEVSHEESVSPEPWSTALQGPSNLTAFSPSMDISAGNLHGLGRGTLDVRVDVALHVARCTLHVDVECWSCN